MTTQHHHKEQMDEGTGLLISILLCYPAINTITFNGEKKELKFSFLLQNLLSNNDFLLFCDHCTLSLEVFYELKGVPSMIPTFQKKACHDVTLVEITCQLCQLSLDTLSLMMQLISTYYQEEILNEEFQTPSSVLKKQEENIATMLKEFQNGSGFHYLIGLRRGGRVMVFDRS